MEELDFKTFKRKCKQKIRTYKHDDKKKRNYNASIVDDKFISFEFIYKMIINDNIKCCKICNCDLLFTNYQRYNGCQYSMDRINSKFYHTEKNIQIICFNCNRRKQDN